MKKLLVEEWNQWLWHLFYRRTIRLIAKLIIFCGNLRDTDHGKTNHMQVNVMDDVVDRLGGFIYVEMAYIDDVPAEVMLSRGWPLWATPLQTSEE